MHINSTSFADLQYLRLES